VETLREEERLCPWRSLRATGRGPVGIRSPLLMGSDVTVWIPGWPRPASIPAISVD
jgi:hypothetical protein